MDKTYKKSTILLDEELEFPKHHAEGS